MSKEEITDYAYWLELDNESIVNRVTYELDKHIDKFKRDSLKFKSYILAKPIDDLSNKKLVYILRVPGYSCGSIDVDKNDNKIKSIYINERPDNSLDYIKNTKIAQSDLMEKFVGCKMKFENRLTRNDLLKELES